MNKAIKLILGAAICAATLFPAAAREPVYGDSHTLAVHPSWVDNAVIYEVNLRQGTAERNLRGMRRELPRLKNLGVDILWLMPIHPISEVNRKGELGSYYAVADYKKVNPEFGTMQDLKDFVNAAHALGMKVIIDEVCNHSGCDNPWIASNPDFYAKDKDGKMFGPFDWTDTYKLDYSNPAMREAMLDVLEFWVREAGIDGYRCDVAMQVPTDFWDEARARLSQIKPVFMLAEASKPELMLKAFDADYNWPMKDVFNSIAATQGVNAFATQKKQNLPKSNARDIVKLLKKQNKQYPAGAINMNMITNHDLNSWEGTEFDRYGEAFIVFATLSYTLPGIPMLYTGQEVGWDRAFEFFKHDLTPDYKANEVTAFYKMLNSLKHNHKALRAGVFNFTELPAGNDNILAFERADGNDKVVVIANLSATVQPLSLKGKGTALGGMTDYFTGNKLNNLPAELSPWQFIVLVNS